MDTTPLDLTPPIWVMAGPCLAESWDLLEEVAENLQNWAQGKPVRYIFKASFDKANRSSWESYRGVGLHKVLGWFEDLKKKYQLEILTDVHETSHVSDVAQVCDHLQIPAFLCRQTDLIMACLQTGRGVNLKKGQFMSPGAMAQIANNAASVERNAPLWVTERGVSFGYGDLVLDFRSLPILAQSQAQVILDITHATQKPSLGGNQKTSRGERCYAPLFARCGAASGYLDGVFLEVHPSPMQAKSDRETQLNISQATEILDQIIFYWNEFKNFTKNDENFV